MNNFKKLSKVLLAIIFVVLIILVAVLVVILINQNTEIQNLKSQAQLQQQTIEESKLPIESNKVAEEIATVIPTIPANYKELTSGNVKTGIFIKNLERFKVETLSEEVCDNADLNIIRAYIDEELSGYPKNDRRFISLQVANKELLGEAKFNEIKNRIESQDLSITPRIIFRTSCAGGGAEAKINHQLNLKTILKEKLLENIAVGGYQYAPAVTEALSTSTALLQKDDNNIVLLSYLLKDSNLLKFSDVTNISTCIDMEFSDSAGYDPVALDCAAKVLAEDSSSLNKIVETVKTYINDLLIKNY